MAPLFEFSDHYDGTVEIAGKVLPIKVKRYSRDEMDAFDTRSVAVMGPRGAGASVDEPAARALMEELIRDGITLAPGLIVDRGADVVDGEGLIGVFHQNKEALARLAAAVLVQNKLGGGLFAKNLNSPRGSETGSEASIPARGGEEQGPTAASADDLSTALVEAVTETSSAILSVGPLASSGEHAAMIATNPS